MHLNSCRICRTRQDLPRGEFIIIALSHFFRSWYSPCLLSGNASTLCCSLPDVNAFSSVAENEDALLKHLFEGYQKWVRPVENSNDTIKVLFGLKISQLVDVVSVVLVKHHFYR